MTGENKLCPISREQVPVTSWAREFGEQRLLDIYDCPRCGQFAMPFLLAHHLVDTFTDNNPERRKVTACLRERKIHGEELLVITDKRDERHDLKLPVVAWDDLIEAFPKTVADRLDRTLLNLAKLSPHPGAPIGQPHGINAYFEPVTFAENDNAMMFALKQLAEEGLIEFDSETRKPLILTAKGWNRIASLERERGRVGTKQAFVAMSYSPELRTLYEQGIETGIEAAGYTSVVSRELEHNEKICDRIIAEIRRSRFLVADFTNHRQNVYFEAGFALGLGLPVIWTCKAGEVGEHFDARQYNHIEWAAPQELAERLAQRIRATIH